MRFLIFNFIAAFTLWFIAGNMQGSTTNYYKCVFSGLGYFIVGISHWLRRVRGNKIK